MPAGPDRIGLKPLPHSQQIHIIYQKDKMATLHTLLVGISKYPIARHRLNGCLNDIAEMNGFLRRYAKAQGMDYRPKILRNKCAKRQDVIDSFQHFAAAQSGDCCLFYFSGHGSQAKTVHQFWNNPSGMNESIVCYDSRLPDGRDLIDKELAYLIWEANRDKEIHFVSIMDCCHAGSGTRLLSEEAYRNIAPHSEPVRLENYYGYAEYFKDRLSPPNGRHVHLAAAADFELAKEKVLDHECRGVFTYCLLQVLQQGGTFQNYETVMNRTRIKVMSETPQQHPQLELVAADGKTGFLGKTTVKGLSYLVSYDQEAGSWLLEAGRVQAIAPSRPDYPTRLVLEDGTQITVVRVYPHRSEVSGMEDKDPAQQYAAQLVQNAAPPLPIGLDPEIDSALAEEILQQTAGNFSIRLAGDAKSARYTVRSRESDLLLTRPGEQIPVFSRVPIRKKFTRQDVKSFLEHVSDVAQWEQLLQHHNPQTYINPDDIRVEVFLPAGEQREETQELLNPAEAVRLAYYREAGEWQKPWLKMRLTNTNAHKTYWVSAVYLSSAFGIDNQYLRKQRLDPGEQAWMGYFHLGQFETVFKIYIAPAYSSWGIQKTTDYIKIFVSEDEALDTDAFTQPDLELDFYRSSSDHSRGIEKAVDVSYPPDWMTKTVELCIEGPAPERAVTSTAFAALPGLAIKGPTGFAAIASLTDYQHAADAFQRPIPNLLQAQGGRPLGIGPKRNQSDGQDVLELYDLKGADVVDADHPIVLKLEQQVSEGETIIPLGYDAQSQLFCVLGYSDPAGITYLEALPASTPTERSPHSSVKVFFQVVEQSELDALDEHPLILDRRKLRAT